MALQCLVFGSVNSKMKASEKKISDVFHARFLRQIIEKRGTW